MAVIPIFGVTYAQKIALTVSDYTQGQWIYQTDTGPSGHPAGYYQLVNSAWVYNGAYANNNLITNRLTIRSPFPGDGPYIGLINDAEASGGQWYIGSAGSANSPGLGAFEIFDFLLQTSRLIISAIGLFTLTTTRLILQNLSGGGGPYLVLSQISSDGGRDYYIGSTGSSNGPGAGYLEIRDNTAGKTRALINAGGSFIIGDGAAALATTATDGFVYIPTCAGPPTGVPTAVTGVKPMVYDTTNNKLYVYNGGWKSVTLA